MSRDLETVGADGNGYYSELMERALNMRATFENSLNVGNQHTIDD